MQRGLPTPPHPTISIPSLSSLSTAPSDLQSMQIQDIVPIPSPHHPRPIPYNRNQMHPPQFLRGYHGGHHNSANGPGTVDIDNINNWQMTEELLADIERADQQQAQSHAYVNENSVGFWQIFLLYL
jgi:hypothetical protein